MNRFIIFLSSIAVLTILSGCDVYTDGFDSSGLDVEECVASGGVCNDESNAFQGLELDIQGPNPIRPVNLGPDCDDDSGKYCFDISGTCNIDKNPVSNILVTSLIDTNSNTDVTFSVRSGPTTCKRGKFWMQIKVDTIPCQIQRATIELTAKDANGTQITNPARAIQTIDMLAQYDPSCS